MEQLTSYYYINKQSGNALFLILIAVVLFAALSYAITQSGRSSGNTSREQAQILASEIIQWTTQLENTVNKLMIINGCGDNEIAFYNTSGAAPSMGNYAYPTADAASIRDECNVYHVDGGGLIPRYVPEGVQRLDDYIVGNEGIFTQSYLPLRGYVKDVGTNGVLNDSSELAVAFPLLSREVCIALNKGLNVENTGGEPPTSASVASNFMSGACKILESRSCSTIQSSTAITELDGQFAACFYTPKSSSWIAEPRYVFYHVLHAG